MIGLALSRKKVLSQAQFRKNKTQAVKTVENKDNQTYNVTLSTSEWMFFIYSAHLATVTTYRQQFPPSVGLSQSVCSYSHVKQARDDQLSGSLPPSLPSSFPSLGRAVCCHLTQTSTCVPPDRAAATQHCSSFYLTSADVTQHSPSLPPSLCSPSWTSASDDWQRARSTPASFKPPRPTPSPFWSSSSSSLILSIFKFAPLAGP